MKIGSSQLKKVCALGVSILLMSQSVMQAGYWDDVMSSSMSNITPSGTFEQKDSNGNLVSTGFYTTSIYFRFGPAFDYAEPPWSISPPSASFGCGGLSLKGMFIRILGLDRLELMLKNAGASLAWGIAIGLIYSLPGVGSAFSYINNWAKKIQQLLANACQSGINIGRNIRSQIPGFEPEYPIAKADSALNEKISAADSWLKNQAKALHLDGLFDDNMVFKFSDDSSVNEDTVKENYRNIFINALIFPSIRSNILMEAVSAMSPSGVETMIKEIFGVSSLSSIQPFSAATFIIKEGKNGPGNVTVITTDFIKKHLANGTSLESQASIQRDIAAYAISTSLAGDVVADKASAIQETMGYIKKIANQIGSSNETVKKELMALVQGTKSITTTVQTMPSVNENSFARALVQYLWKGNTNPQDADKYHELEKVKALRFVAVAMPHRGSENVQGKMDIVFIPVAETDTSFFDLSDTTKEGAVKASEKAINYYLGIIQNNPANTNGQQVQQPDINILVPGIIDKIKILQETPEDKREGLKNLLVMYNAYHYVENMLLGAVELSGKVQATAPIVFLDGTGVSVPLKSTRDFKFESSNLRWENYRKALMLNAQKMSKIRQLGINELNTLISNSKPIKSPEELNKIFYEVDKENKARSIKALDR